jgi:hypothetical protein
MAGIFSNVDSFLESLKNGKNESVKQVVDTSGRSTGTAPNVAQNQIGADIAGGITNIASSAIQGSLQNSTVNSVKSSSLDQANKNRNTTLSLKKKVQELDVKNFELKKLQDNETLRHRTWLNDFQQALKNNTQLNTAVSGLIGEASKSEDIKSIIVNAFRRK